MKIRQSERIALRTMAVATAFLAASGSTAGQTETAEKTRLKKISLGEIQQVHAFGDIYLTGQPTPSDLVRLKARGVKTIISLRHTKELPWDEASAVEQNGMKFVHVPFVAAQQLKPEIFDKVLKILRDKRRAPTVLHCGAANRVGAIWYAYRVLDGELSPAAAMKEAQAVGLRTPEYLDRAHEYVEGVRKAEQVGKAPRSTQPQ